MKSQKFISFILSITAIALLVGTASFSQNSEKKPVSAYDLPISEHYCTLAATTNLAHTYTSSPTAEPWYKTAHSYRNTSDPENKYYDFCQRDVTYNRMNVSSTWNSYRGEGVKVAVIDTGCYTAHEDFNGTTISGLSKNMATSSTGLVAINDTHGHGSSSAATIAAAVNNVGGTGIAPNVELIVIKATDANNAFPSNYINNALQYCIDNDVDIINLSVQGYTSSFSTTYIEDFGEVEVSTTSTGIASSSTYSSKLNACYNAGITVVAAAGNYNSTNKSYPAANNHVIAVGSTGLVNSNNKAGFSNYGDWVDIYAPGYITTPTLTSSSSYSITYGTSFSAPLVTGAIALYKSKFPTATPDQIERALKFSATSTDISCSGKAIDVGAFLACPPDKVFAESISLNESTKTLKVGETYQINATVLPTGADQSLKFESLDEDIISVNSTGLVTALKTGTGMVGIYSAENEDIYDVMEFTVEASSDTPITASVVLINGVASGSPLSITWTLENVLTIKQEKNTGSSDVNSSYISVPRWYTGHKVTFTPIDGIQIKEIKFTCGSNSYAKALSESTWSNGTVNVSNNVVTWTGNATNPFNVVLNDQSRISSISVTYVKGGATPVTLSSISVSNNHRTFTVGEAFVKETVTATYSDSNTKDVTSDASFTGYDMSKAATYTVLVSYTENQITKETSYQITVNSPAPVTNYTVYFNSNNGKGSMNNATTNGSTYVVPECGFTRDGYTFSKWALNNINGTKYSVGETINNISSNITLYAIWINSSQDDYYKDIDDNLTGDTLLTSLRTLNLAKRTSTVGYSNMGTTPSGMFKYTDYDPSTVQYDEKGQPYGTKILSFYSGKPTTSWNREHVWPNSRGGGSGGTAGSPYPDADIFMPRPTISEENSNRGNSAYVTGMVSASDGWDPVAAFENTIGVYPGIRGECARIIFYCMTVNSKLVLNENISTSGDDMGKLSDLIEWHLSNPVNERELNRQSGGQYLQGNRNAFVDHPEYVCKVWGNYNDKTRELCSKKPVAQKTLESITLSGSLSKTEFYAGDSFDPTGLTITAHFDDESTATVTNNVVWSPSTLSINTTSVTGTYTHMGVSKQVTVSGFTVSQKSVVGGEYTLEFKDNGSDGSNEISKENILTETYVKTNTLADSLTSASKIYPGSTGLKLGSKSENGSFTINLKTEAQTSIESVEVSLKQYGSDEGILNVQVGNKNLTFTPPSTLGTLKQTFKTPINATSLTVSTSSKRAYLSKITLKVKATDPSPQVRSITMDETLNLDLYNKVTHTLIPIIDADEGAETTISWSSTDSSVASVSNNGLVTALKVGTTNIIATCGGKTATCVVTVDDSTPIPVTGVNLNKTSTYITAGSTETLVATVLPTNATNKNVTWSSDNINVASVNNGIVTAKAAGTAHISVTTEDGNYTASCTVNVTSPEIVTLTSIEIVASKTTFSWISQVNSVSADVIAHYSNGTSSNVTSSATKNFSIDTSSLGYQSITASYEGKDTSLDIKITNDGAQDDVGISTEKQTLTSTYTFTAMDGSYTGGISGTTVTTTNANGFEPGSTGRGIQWSKAEGSITINKGTSSLDTFVIKSISVVCSKNDGSPSMSIKIGQTSFASSQTVSGNNNTLTFNNTGGLSGDSIVVSTAKGSKSVWVKSIAITYETAGISYLATPNQQAKAWADFFIRQTRTLETCLAQTDAAKLFGLKSVWNYLKEEYEFMVGDAKNEFCNSNDSLIVEARDHYKFIISKYGSSNLNDFIVNSDNVKLSALNAVSKLDSSHISFVFVTSIIAVSLLATSIYVFKKKNSN